MNTDLTYDVYDKPDNVSRRKGSDGENITVYEFIIKKSETSCENVFVEEFKGSYTYNSVGISKLNESSNRVKCPRCWHYEENSLYNFDNLCCRCCDILVKDYPDHDATKNILNKTPQIPEYYSKLFGDLSDEFDDEISSTMQRICDILPKDVSENPEYFLGKNYETVLNFWKYLDHLSPEKWKEMDDKFLDLLGEKELQENQFYFDDYLRSCAGDIKDLAWWVSCESVLFSAPEDLPRTIKVFSKNLIVSKVAYVASLATLELMGMLKRRTIVPKFLPLFV